MGTPPLDHLGQMSNRIMRLHRVVRRWLAMRVTLAFSQFTAHASHNQRLPIKQAIEARASTRRLLDAGSLEMSLFVFSK